MTLVCQKGQDRISAAPPKENIKKSITSYSSCFPNQNEMRSVVEIGNLNCSSRAVRSAVDDTFLSSDSHRDIRANRSERVRHLKCQSRSKVGHETTRGDDHPQEEARPDKHILSQRSFLQSRCETVWREELQPGRRQRHRRRKGAWRQKV